MPGTKVDIVIAFSQPFQRQVDVQRFLGRTPNVLGMIVSWIKHPEKSLAFLGGELHLLG